MRPGLALLLLPVLSLAPVLAAAQGRVVPQGVPASPGLAATAPFVGVWEAIGDGRLYDVHHAGPFLLWITPSDGSWVGSAHAVVGVAGPAARPPARSARITSSGDGTVRLTLPDGAGGDGDGVAPLRDAPLRRVADAPPHDMALAAAFCDTDALAFPRPGVRRRDETGGLRGIGPRADLRDAILTGLDLRGWDLGSVLNDADAFAGNVNSYAFASPLPAGGTVTAALTWFADRTVGSTVASAEDVALSNLSLQLFRTDALGGPSLVAQ